jgi:hypothetical protein
VSWLRRCGGRSHGDAFSYHALGVGMGAGVGVGERASLEGVGVGVGVGRQLLLAVEGPCVRSSVHSGRSRSRRRLDESSQNVEHEHDVTATSWVGVGARNECRQREARVGGDVETDTPQHVGAGSSILSDQRGGRTQELYSCVRPRAHRRKS